MGIGLETIFVGRVKTAFAPAPAGIARSTPIMAHPPMPKAQASMSVAEEKLSIVQSQMPIARAQMVKAQPPTLIVARRWSKRAISPRCKETARKERRLSQAPTLTPRAAATSSLSLAGKWPLRAFRWIGAWERRRSLCARRIPLAPPSRFQVPPGNAIVGEVSLPRRGAGTKHSFGEMRVPKRSLGTRKRNIPKFALTVGPF